MDRSLETPGLVQYLYNNNSKNKKKIKQNSQNQCNLYKSQIIQCSTRWKRLGIEHKGFAERRINASNNCNMIKTEFCVLIFHDQN